MRERWGFMKIILSQQNNMKRGELALVYHPKNEYLAHYIKNLIEGKMGEIEVVDDYHNRFLVSLLNIYYFEVIDTRVFVYTRDEVYRLMKNFFEVKMMLHHKGFKQINVRTIVNERHVIQYQMLKGCHRKLILDNGESVVSNRQFKDQVDDMIKRRRIDMKEDKIK